MSDNKFKNKYPLHGIINPDRISILINYRNVNVDEKDENGNTALHVARFDYIAKSLIEHDANIEAKNNRGETPLFTSVDESVAKVLIKENADIEAENDFGATPIHEATKKPEKLKLLLKSGAKTEKTEKHGKTPIFSAVNHKNLESVKILIDADVEINIQDKKMENTPLHEAVQTSQHDIAEILLINGANQEIENKNGKTPKDLLKSLPKVDKKTLLKMTKLLNDFSMGRRKSIIKLDINNNREKISKPKIAEILKNKIKHR
jgi:ankyrin repeat protein